MPALTDRILIHLADGLRRPLDPADLYYLEAIEGATELRTRSSRLLVDVRPLGELAPLLAPRGFLRVHRNHMVNLRRVREIRRRPTGDDWELKLNPPVNRVLPISRSHLEEVWKAFGEGR
jgi:DNA-binding LytR/AlgR family response regulator